MDACTVMDAEHKWFDTYGKRIEDILAALVKGLPADTVNLVLAHLLVDGARVGTGERELHLGQIYGVNPQQLPSAVQYIGLGHLHRPQEVLAPAKTRYPGSLIELDFGEQEQDKSVVVLDAQPQRPPVVELVEVTAGLTAAHGRGHAGRPAAPRRREERRLPARQGEGRSADARTRRACQGAPPERPRGHRGPPTRRRQGARRARQGTREARPRPALRCLLRVPPPDPPAQGAAAALRRRCTRTSRSEAVQAHAGGLHLLPRQDRDGLLGPRPLRHHRPDRRRQVVPDRRHLLRPLWPGPPRGRRLQAAHLPRGRAPLGHARVRSGEGALPHRAHGAPRQALPAAPRADHPQR